MKKDCLYNIRTVVFSERMVRDDSARDYLTDKFRNFFGFQDYKSDSAHQNELSKPNRPEHCSYRKFVDLVWIQVFNDPVRRLLLREK